MGRGRISGAFQNTIFHMRIGHSFHPSLKRLAVVFGILLAPVLWGQTPAPTAMVAPSSVKYTPDAANKKLAVAFRLVDAIKVTQITAAAETSGATVPTTWAVPAPDKAPACAWQVVVDVSNPRGRAATLAKCAGFVKSFVAALPPQDQVEVSALAANLVEKAPFGTPRGEYPGKVSALAVSEGESQATLVYQNVLSGLPRLAARPEPSKALLLLTDGLDETPDAAARQDAIERLKKAAGDAGIVIHCIGYPEKASDAANFGTLKDLALAREGLFAPADAGTKAPVAGFSELLMGVMHEIVTVHLDLSGLKNPVSLSLGVKTASGASATLKVPEDRVTSALTPVTPEPVAPADKGEKPDPTPKSKPDDSKESPGKTAKPPGPAAKEGVTTWQEKLGKQPMPFVIGGAVLLVVLLVTMMSKASRRRAEESARWQAEAEAARMAEVDAGTVLLRGASITPAIAWLEMCDDIQTRHPVTLSTVKIGRGQHNDLVLRNDSVSGNHCVISRTREGHWSITDLNSGNGVIVNGKRVAQAPLSHGDVVELGDLKMRFLTQA